ncbi:hypothetical protein ABE488_05185 [Luteimonas sp. TWI662]|uniref:hypothetical protein n=1 Tax=Luteimonas sp. TWI662 TaxID=3136789 RepID=UPI00320A90DB
MLDASPKRKRRIMRADVLAAGWLLSLCGTAAAAAGPATSSPPPDFSCSHLADAVARLACYDRAFPPVFGATPAEALHGEAFGLPLPPRERDSMSDRIEARVVAVDDLGDRRTVALDNGQVWTLTEVTARGPLTPGEAVSIRRGAMGGYMLRTPAGVSLRARRLR